MSTMLEIEGLSAFYGKAQALTDVSFSVAEGEIVGVIGANGAGKSTLLDSIMGLTTTTGAIRLGGDDIAGLATAEIVKRGVGYAPERANLFRTSVEADPLDLSSLSRLSRKSPVRTSLTDRDEDETVAGDGQQSYDDVDNVGDETVVDVLLLRGLFSARLLRRHFTAHSLWVGNGTVWAWDLRCVSPSWLRGKLIISCR
ncbi:MAG: ATP-binding cassette domain-containing protein [Pseudomonadota bacterium]